MYSKADSIKGLAGSAANTTFTAGSAANTTFTAGSAANTTFTIHTNRMTPSFVKQVADTFSPSLGFAEQKPIAIQLLRDVTVALDEAGIPYCLACGTLLGAVRHRDFIPWDDDMDLLVDGQAFLQQLSTISDHPRFNLNNVIDDLYKITYKELAFPFIDLFLTTAVNDNTITFFGKTWDSTKIFPPIKSVFLGIPVCLPRDPLYFLYRNFGKDCLVNAVSSGGNHRTKQVMKHIMKVRLPDVYHALAEAEASKRKIK
jgi:hypothetical protein